ncbi:LysR family transcriptional regulator [Embleya sp. AB8]|uniref:LysR family transcriptional regulator n=1 Tax=Embleya sp. AB8 TaxID=3156304 RepID=UPI003C70ABAE
MERHEIEVFLTLAEQLHFGRTAERLGVSQARVSQTVKKLERRLGVLLFERTSRKVKLTPTGRQFFDDLLPGHQQIQRAVVSAIAAGRSARGHLCVGYSSPMAAGVVLRGVSAFLERHPGCEVQTKEVQLSDPFGPLRAADVDLQLTELPVAEPDLATGPALLREQRVFLVPTTHTLAAHDSLRFEDLADIPWITVAGAVPAYWTQAHYPEHTPGGRRIPRGPAATYWQEVLALVAAGYGGSPTCARAELYYARPDVRYIPVRDAPPVEYALVWRTSGMTPPLHELARHLVSAARKDSSRPLAEGGTAESADRGVGPPPIGG